MKHELIERAEKGQAWQVRRGNTFLTLVVEVFNGPICGAVRAKHLASRITVWLSRAGIAAVTRFLTQP
jgi:hypothetical protein